MAVWYVSVGAFVAFTVRDFEVVSKKPSDYERLSADGSV